MEGRVMWYKPGSGHGRLISNSGRRFAFHTRGEDSTIHGGARVVFKVAEMDGELVGMSVRVTESCLDALLHEHKQLAHEFSSVVTIEA